ncbi:hypothetical protein [Enterobacter sp. WCHEn045836]|uniref:hypothetical protein n=1 Tax=Enterobacter sp. WCHEn045836 TaxID=2497434 RepID=UPI00163A1E21|nr:hypothetical protein [Enterobacter sp. WCHEn045836]
MARRIEIQIDNETYVGDTAPARDQVEMLNIASRYNLLPIVRDDMGDMGAVAVVATLDMPLIERLKKLGVAGGSVIRSSDRVPVSENLFQDEPHLFLLLIAKVLKENIGPFWQLSKKEPNPEPEATDKKPELTGSSGGHARE